MNLDKYTEKTQAIIQSSQTLALANNHQKLSAQHLLEAMLYDSDGYIANLIQIAQGNVELIRSQSKRH